MHACALRACAVWPHALPCRAALLPWLATTMCPWQQPSCRPRQPMRYAEKPGARAACQMRCSNAGWMAGSAPGQTLPACCPSELAGELLHTLRGEPRMNRRCATASVAASGAAAAAALATMLWETRLLRAAAGRAGTSGTCSAGGRAGGWGVRCVRCAATHACAASCGQHNHCVCVRARACKPAGAGPQRRVLCQQPEAHCCAHRTERLHAAKLRLPERRLRRHWPLRPHSDCGLHGCDSPPQPAGPNNV